MIEKKLFQEIPGGKNSFHTAILTSFSFNFHHFEYQVLKTLRNKWISSITVLVDQRMLDDVLGYASHHLKHLSQSYSVVGIRSIGAFHPKINFLIGDDKVLMFFGSGNITPGGHGKNHELFTGFYIDKYDQTQLPVIIEGWRYLLQISNDLEGYNKNRIFNEIPNSCKWLQNLQQTEKHEFYRIDKDIEVSLLYNEETNILNQLTSLVPAHEISRITVVCPYFDKDGETLLNFKRHFPEATIDIYLQNEFGLPPIEMPANQAMQFYSWENTKRGGKKIKSSEGYIRKLHSKIFHFKSESFEYLIVGSANATINAFGGTTKKSSNEEFCTLYRSSKGNLLKSIGIVGKKKKVVLSNLKRDENINEENNAERKNRSVHLTNTDLSGSRLILFFKTTQKIEFSILNIFNSNGNKIIEQEIDLQQNSPVNLYLDKKILKLNPSYIEINNEDDEPISNKQIINFVDKLINTDPTQGNRNIQQILSSIEGGTLNEFEIIDFINNLSVGHQEQKIRTFGRGYFGKRSNVNASEMTYDEAIKASKNKQEHEKIIQTHSSTRLWDSISRLLKELQLANDEELFNEEEEADAKSSRDRKKPPTQDQPIIIKNRREENIFKNRIEKLVNDYKSVLDKVVNSEAHEIDLIDLSQFLLVTHIFNTICNFSEFKFKNEKDQFEWENYLYEFYRHSMDNILTLFTKLLVKFNLYKHKNNEYQQTKLNKYYKQSIFHFWVYVYFVYRKTRENSVREHLYLMGLNMLYFNGVPDDEFETYIGRLFVKTEQLSFDADSIIKFQESILKRLESSSITADYIFLSHSGICKILDKTGSHITYSSLYGKNKISNRNLKKHKKLNFEK